MLRVPYYQQVFEYTCGPATLRMVAKFLGKPVGRLQAVRLCKTDADHGTSRSNLIHAARAHGLHVHAHTEGTLKEIRALLSKGIPVIVNYREPEDEVGHYAVVVGVTKHTVVLSDPYHGPRLKLGRREFVRRWYGKHARVHRRWLMAVSKNYRIFPHH